MYGHMGGGESIPHKDPITGNPNILSFDGMDEIYNNKFDVKRHGIFHYAIMAHRIQYKEKDGSISTDRSGSSEISGDYFRLACDVIGAETIAVAGTFMHELGHNLGLAYGDPSDKASYWWGIDRNYGDGYPSCMNYDFQFNLVDYSCGTHGSDDHDDWGTIDLTVHA